MRCCPTLSKRKWWRSDPARRRPQRTKESAIYEGAALGLRGKWLLSYNDDAWVRRLYRGRGLHVESVETKYGIQGGLWKRAKELLIRN